VTAPALVVLAKAPIPGEVKTRLCPPCSPAQAARLARAALQDTLDTVSATEVKRRVLVLDGPSQGWARPRFELRRQSAGGLAQRISCALDELRGPGLLIGMDTPQLTSRLLSESLDTLCEPGVDAVLGPALDGGYWCVGMRRHDPNAFAGIPMSVPGTLAAQRERLSRLSLHTVELPPMRDIDTFADAQAVATAAPWTRFAAELKAVMAELAA